MTAICMRAALMGAMLSLAACGGGGGGSPSPSPPAPPPADTTPPDTTLGGAPALSTAQRTASFTLTSSEANSTFEASLDGAAYAVVTSPHALGNLADGVHTVNVRARDAATNVDASPATFTWLVDGTAPSVRVLFPGSNAYTDQASIQLRGTANDASAITSLTVNGAVATTADNFHNWTATVAVAAGNNDYTIATTDNLGNSSTSAATVNIANRGAVLGSINSVALDNSRDRLLVADWERGDVTAVRISDGVASVFSGVTRGAGPIIGTPRGLFVDTPRNRLLTYSSSDQAVWEFDLDTGDREEVSTSGTGDFTAYGGQFDYDAANDIVYLANGFPQRVLEIDLANDTREIISSGFVGAGPLMVQPTDVVIDTSAAGGGHRLLVADVVSIPGQDESRLFAVDLATGNRSVLSTSATPAVGTGPKMYGIGSLELDAVNNRVLAAVYSYDEQVRVIAIDLATGNRTVLGISDSRSYSAGFVYDGPSSRAFLALGDRARLQRFDLTTQQFVRFSDSLVGTGPVAVQFNSLDLDTSGDTPSLIVGVQLGQFAAAMRINPATGTRSLLTGGGLGTGPELRVVRTVQRDTRAGAPPNQLLAFDAGVLPSSVLTVDLATGNRAIASSPEVHYSSSPVVTLDAANGRMLAAVRNDFSEEHALAGINVNTGVTTTISKPGVLGSGPEFAPVYGNVIAIGIDAPAGGAVRYLVAGSEGKILAVNATTGDRTLLWPHNGGVDIAAYDLWVDSAARRTYVMSNYGVLRYLDLGNNEMTLVSGNDVTTSTARGSGPEIVGYNRKLQANPAIGVIYVTNSDDSIVAVDMGTGQRAIVSR